MPVEFETLDVLLVEDDALMRRLTRRMLEELKVRSIAEAEDGRQALDMVMVAQPLFGLILADLSMPNLDGFGFIEGVRRADREGLADIPIVVLSGHIGGGNVSRAVKLGIHGFIDKPVSLETLSRQIEKALSGKRLGPPDSLRKAD